jgi:hypothetical protein
MRIVGIGPSVRHTLVAIEHERARRATVREVSYEGGVKLVCKLISRISPTAPGPHIIPINSESIRTFAECRQYRVNLDVPSKDQTWRIDRVVGQTDFNFSSNLDMGKQAADLLVVEVPHVMDQALGDPSFIESRVIGKKAGDGWVVVKTEAPDYIGSALYYSLHELYEARHIIVMSLSTARRMNKSPLIGSLSWEATAEAIQAALIRELAPLDKKLPHTVVISIKNDGAACFHCLSEPRLTLIYDPSGIEGEWAKLRPGFLTGKTQCIAAAVAAGAMNNFTADSLENYVIAGLHGGRRLHETGFRLNQKVPFPTTEVAKQIAALIPAQPHDAAFEVVTIPAGGEVNWSIAKQSILSAGPGVVSINEWSNIKEKISGLVKSGMQQYRSVPVVQFGPLTAVLRDEIEGLRAIRGLMREYSNRDSNSRPLSIAVFGWPGSGKSFAVKAVAKSIRNSRRAFKILEFNLSQFSDPNQIYEALHQVRDLALAGEMPLVFFDEFDGDFHGQYGWLRYFLAPMQDGKFTQGQMSHSVGNAVFVFAGGTSNDMQTFRKSVELATAAKGPDFLSRLQGFVNISSLDHGEETLLAGVFVRRAILLREYLKELAPGIIGRSGIDIDESVMTALMCIPKYRYGARSMGAILTMSSLQGKTRFEPSCLPPADQIDLHVDSSEWLLLLEGSHKLLGNADPDDPLIGW